MRCKPGLNTRLVQFGTALRIDKDQPHIAARATPLDTRGKIFAKMDNIIGTAFACRFRKDTPAGPALMFMQGDTDPGLTATPRQARRNHRSIIGHKKVTRGQDGW
ncbi:MAG: Uncharacterised protein [SAR116 cluster bacterium]|nr:MAG: Uncharacterised protein [SAR116 cluster bacterium]